jgi:invasion protein IalB
MTHRIVSASARPLRRTLAAVASAALLTAGAASEAFAQQPAQQPAPRQQTQPAKPPAKPPAQKAAPQKPAEQPAPQAQQQPQGGDQQIQLIYSPWTKFCHKAQEAGAKQVCFTGKDARIESGMPVVAVVLIEPEGEPKKFIRVTVPLGMQLKHGTRFIIDQEQPMTAPYVACLPNSGCMSEYEANAELVGKMKKGQGIVVQMIDLAGRPISLALPLGDFAKAYDGPPTDPKAFEEQQKRLEEALRKRADDALKKIEGQPGQQGQPGPAPAKPQ